MMKLTANAKLCIVPLEQPEEIFRVNGFFGLIGISEYGKLHSKHGWIVVQICYFFLGMQPKYRDYLYFCPKQ